jgi:hypothetical protein
MMEIKTRKQAMIDGENTYFTGKPCKNGHMSYRYVQSGTCYDCINATRLAPDSPTATAREQRLTEAAKVMRAKNLVKENLALVKVRLFAAEREGVALIAYALATMRFPMLKVSDVDPKLAPIGSEPSGTALYQFYCYDDDIATLRDAAAATFTKYVPDFEARRRELIASAATYLPKDSTPPMSFK